MWYGDSCNRIVNYNTSVGAVTVTILDNFKATKRMDGNEMFLAKAHHRLRQIQALLRKPGLGNDKKLLGDQNGACLDWGKASLLGDKLAKVWLKEQC